MAIGVQSPVLLPNQVHVWIGRPREQVLSSYLDIESSELTFAKSEHGKPRISGPVDCDLHFNVSHSGALEALAVASGRHVGVDIEHIDPGRSIAAIAERFFSSDDLVRLETLAPAERVEAFYRLWTVREARAKALGLGLAGLNTAGANDLPSVPLELPGGYVGYVAAAGAPFEVLQIPG